MPSSKLTHFVLGFAFDESASHVALILKDHGPADVAGRLNGIGGKVKPGELSPAAMRREFHEEAGVDFIHWRHYETMIGETWICDCYAARMSFVEFDEIRTMEREPVFKVTVESAVLNTCLREIAARPESGDISTVPNVGWLILRALDTERRATETSGGGPVGVQITDYRTPNRPAA